MKIEAVVGPFAAALGALALVACASAPLPPTDAFKTADTAIGNAEKDKAAEFAPVEMKSAHDKMTAARAAAAKKDAEEEDVVQARRLAEQAGADAEYASAKARDARAAAVNVELQKNIDTLKQELQRSTGGAS